jgi:hypothetical protein
LNCFWAKVLDANARSLRAALGSPKEVVFCSGRFNAFSRLTARRTKPPKEQIGNLIAQRVAGLILIGAPDDIKIVEKVARRILVVCVGRHLEAEAIDRFQVAMRAHGLEPQGSSPRMRSRCRSARSPSERAKKFPINS